MNNVIISSLTLFLMFVTFTPGSVSSVRILIKKIEMEGWLLKSANISCLAEDIGHHVLQIVSIQLSGPGNVAIASLGYNSTVTLDKDLYFSKIEAEGSIQKETWKSHLTIVMTDILSSQTGMYTCEIHYFDQEGFIRDDITSNILDAGEQDTSQVLLYMSSRISTLEDRIAELEKLPDKVETHYSEVGRLEDLTRNQSLVIKDLVEKDQPCGFSARHHDADIMVAGQVLVFRYVDTNIGEAYNPTTGNFTTPRTGMYAFQLTIMSDQPDKKVWVDLYANDQLVGQLFARDEKDIDQTSVSVTVKLLTGQVVRPVVKSFNYERLDDNRYVSVFSGYLVQAM